MLRLYTAFGRVGKRSNDDKNNNSSDNGENIGVPFVLFGANTRREILANAEGRKRGTEDNLTSSTPTLAATGSSQMIIKVVEPLTGISCTRTYFLEKSWIDASDKDPTDAVSLAKLYSIAVDTTLKSIQAFAKSKSPSLTETFVKDELANRFKELPGNIAISGWEFRLEGFRLDGSHVPLKDGRTVRCLKRATISIYDATVKSTVRGTDQVAKKPLGSVAFAETFVDSHVETKDCNGAMGSDDTVFCLTEGDLYVYILVEAST